MFNKCKRIAKQYNLWYQYISVLGLKIYTFCVKSTINFKHLLLTKKHELMQLVKRYLM